MPQRSDNCLLKSFGWTGFFFVFVIACDVTEMATQFNFDLGALPIEEAFEASPALKRVNAFRRKASFAAAERNLYILDASETRFPTPVFQISEAVNHDILIAATTKGTEVLVSDGRAIYRVNKNGESDELVNLETLEVPQIQHAIRGGSIHHLLAPTKNMEYLYFKVDYAHESFVCKINVNTKLLRYARLNRLGTNAIDVDVNKDVVYALQFGDSLGENWVVARDFGGMVDKRTKLSRRYWNCELSPNRETLLLSSGVYDEEAVIALLNIERFEETTLHLGGTDARWGGDDSIFFLEGENSLWKYEIGDKYSTRLFLIRGKRPSNTMSYAESPTVSANKSWLYWRWAVAGRLGPRLGSILLDLKSNEYRILNKNPVTFWRHVRWLK